MAWRLDNLAHWLISIQARPRGGLVWGHAHTARVRDIYRFYKEARRLRVLQKGPDGLRLGRFIKFGTRRGEGYTVEAQGPVLEGARVFIDIGAAVGVL